VAHTEGSTQVDLSSSYNVNKHPELSFEGRNVTNTPFSQRVDVEAQRRALYSQYGRTFLLGARQSRCTNAGHSG
jgi:outer membrane receptor protein involved in Fe transport